MVATLARPCGLVIFSRRGLSVPFLSLGLLTSVLHQRRLANYSFSPHDCQSARAQGRGGSTSLRREVRLAEARRCSQLLTRARRHRTFKTYFEEEGDPGSFELLARDAETAGIMTKDEVRRGELNRLCSALTLSNIAGSRFPQDK